MNATERTQARLIGEEVMRLRAEVVALRRRAERTEMDLQNMEIAQADARERVALLEGLLREALGWIEPIWQDPRDPARRKVLRRIHVALADGG